MNNFLLFFIGLLSINSTGVYPGEGPNSHSDMNHDLGSGSSFWFTPEVINRSVNWNSKDAEDVAVKAIIQYNNKIESKLD